MVTPITKYFAAVMSADDIPQIMEDAYYYAMEGRKGPVWIDVPVNIQNSQVSEKAILDIVKREFKNKFIDEKMLADIANRILKSKKPLIMAGYGIRSSNSVELLERLSTNYDIPIVTSRGGIDVVNSDSKLFIGRPGSYGDRASHFAVQEADLFLILGSRLSISTVGYYPQRFGKNAFKVMVDIDDKELNKEDVPVDYKISADLNEWLNKLLGYMSGKECTHTEWVDHCNEYKEKYPTVVNEYKDEKPLNEYYVTSVIADLASKNSNIVVDTGSVCNIVSQSWKIKKGQRYLVSGGLSCMGFWATALGVCQNDRQVIAISGDGSTQMNIQELATMQYNKIPVKLFVYNNNGYMLIRHNQHNYMEDRFLGVGPDSGLQTPDFCKVAEAYGVKNIRIQSGDNIEAKIKEVLEFNGPVVCEVICQQFAPIIPRIASRVMPDGSLKAAEFEDLYPFLD